MASAPASRMAKITMAIAGAVAATPTGAPSGPMYAALMGEVSLDEYETAVGILVRTGLVERRSHVVFPSASLLQAVAK